MKAIKFLNMLVDSLPLLEVLAEMSSSVVDDWLLSLGEKLKDDPDLLIELAAWLALVPGFEAKQVPYKLKDMDVSLGSLRNALRYVK